MAAKPQPSANSGSGAYGMSTSIYASPLIHLTYESELWQRPPGTSPALDLTGKIMKLEDYPAKTGGFSDVYKCRYTTRNGVKEVAVKAFRFHFSVTRKADKTDKMIRRELGIWSMLRHPNVVPFLGFVCDFGRRGSTSLVSEWMPNGTLGGFCERYDDQLMLVHRLQLLLDIANGLSYLHSLPVVHGDLSCTNVLIDRNFNACLTDFGLASMIGDIPDALQYLQMTSLRPGAIRWSAPEQFSPNANAMTKHTTKSDIYSFGNLSLFTLSGEHPWSEVQLDIAVILRLHQGDKPGRPASRAIENDHWEFIEHCWSTVNERPRAEDIVASMQMFLDFCLPDTPRHFVGIPPDSIEPLGASSSLDPRTKNPWHVHFDDTCRYSPALPRKPSWHGEITPGSYSSIQSALQPKRRRSFDRRATPQEHTSPWPDTPSFQIHPLLNGEARGIDFYFDLASPIFNPHPRSGPQGIAITWEFQKHATYPPTARMRITHDSIPQWPIDLGVRNDDQKFPPSHSPITVFDVLCAVYLSLHQGITRHDWARLGQHEGHGIEAAYRQRCRSVLSLADAQASQGVKRIDYLLENHIFGGLVKTHDEDGFSCWKLIVVTDSEYQRLGSLSE